MRFDNARTTSSERQTPEVGEGAPISRARFLRTAAGVVAGGGALLGGAGAVQAAARAPGARDASNAPKALEVSMVRDLTGPDQTGKFGMAATDLGIPVKTPDGRLLFVFGDTWEDQPMGKDWRAPVGLYSKTKDLAKGVEWSGAVGGDRAQQLWEYDHDNPEFATVLPSDVITIGDTMYLHVGVQNPYPNVVWTEIWSSKDSGATWEHTGARWGREGDPGLDPLFQLVSWALDDDGYVYVFSTKFDRTDSVIMHRVRAEDITKPTAYQPWGYTDGKWGWGKWGDRVDPILKGKFGELCLRPVGDKWLFTCLNLDAEGIEGRVLDSPTANVQDAPAQKLIENVSWADNDPEHGKVAQCYGGYIIPGSTLDDLHLAVSQWENPDNPEPEGWHYNVMQHRVQGLGG